MEQDIWFYERIKDDPLPDPQELRIHLRLDNNYHFVMVTNVFRPRVWQGAC